MPKRPNPFGDNSPLQVKTHVGKKEVDMGVNQSENMQTVYDRTRDLLYQGSRKPCNPCDAEPMSDWTEGVGRNPLPTRSLQGQLCIGADGSLCGDRGDGARADKFRFQMVGSGAEAMDTEAAAGGMMNNNSVMMPYPPPSGQMTLDPSGKLTNKASAQSSLTAPPSGFRICQSCNRPSNLRPRVCSFCEKITCSNCLRQCSNCEGLFCQVCSTINYDDCSDRIYCLQCVN